MLLAFLNYGAFSFAYLAMSKVSYTFVLLTMSAKIIPVLMVGTVRGIYKPNAKQVILAVSLSVGLIIFNSGKISSTDECELSGMCLLFMSLLFEGV